MGEVSSSTRQSENQINSGTKLKIKLELNIVYGTFGSALLPDLISICYSIIKTSLNYAVSTR